MPGDRLSGMTGSDPKRTFTVTCKPLARPCCGSSRDTIGHVPWWPDDRNEVTLHRILVHLIAETDRHAGHADIVRELIDGAAGLRNGNDNLAPGDQAWWENYRSRLERVAQEVGQGGG